MVTAHDIIMNADLWRAAYPHWPHPEPERDSPEPPEPAPDPASQEQASANFDEAGRCRGEPLPAAGPRPFSNTGVAAAPDDVRSSERAGAGASPPPTLQA